jgi:hypothetical protein
VVAVETADDDSDPRKHEGRMEGKLNGISILAGNLEAGVDEKKEWGKKKGVSHRTSTARAA